MLDEDRRPCDPVGAPEIAARMTDLGVHTGLRTVHMWRHRQATSGFPEPRWRVGGGPAWDWCLDIVPWLIATRRVDRGAFPPDEAGQ